MGNIWTSITDVPIHLAQHANMFVTVEQGVFVFAVHAGATRPSMRGFVCLKTGIGKNNNQTLRVLVVRGDWCFLFGRKPWQRWRRKRLRSYRSMRASSQLWRCHGSRRPCIDSV